VLPFDFNAKVKQRVGNCLARIEKYCGCPGVGIFQAVADIQPWRTIDPDEKPILSIPFSGILAFKGEISDDSILISPSPSPRLLDDQQKVAIEIATPKHRNNILNPSTEPGISVKCSADFPLMFRKTRGSVSIDYSYRCNAQGPENVAHYGTEISSETRQKSIDTDLLISS